MSKMEEITHHLFLKKAIHLARLSLQSGGGPFGALIVKDGIIIATGHNCVVPSHDPTAHAEIVALREAAKKLKTHYLKGAVLYSSCEPCPMCLSAAYWAHIDSIWYGATRSEAAHVGFDDEYLYKELCLPLNERSLPIHHIHEAGAAAVFEEWQKKTDKIRY